MPSMVSLIKLLRRIRLWIYTRLSFQHSLPIPHCASVRLFRFGLPFVLKTTPRTESTETDALQYLNSQFQGRDRLPIPRLYDSFVLDGESHALISKIPGESIYEIGHADFPMVYKEIESVMRRVWALKQPADLKGQVMVSASGHGMPTGTDLDENLRGPFPNSEECYAYLTGYDTGSGLIKDLSVVHGDVKKILQEDPLVFTHTDLRLQNILVTPDKHLSGIIDWEDAGWLPMQRQWHLLQLPHQCLWGPYRRYWEAMDIDPKTRKAHEVALSGYQHLANIPEYISEEPWPVYNSANNIVSG